jgi:anti-sigma factor RsiW
MVTEFELHAFIDGELADEERANILDACAKSVALRTQLQQLLRLKDLVRTSYHEVEHPRGGMLEMIG